MTVAPQRLAPLERLLGLLPSGDVDEGHDHVVDGCPAPGRSGSRSRAPRPGRASPGGRSRPPGRRRAHFVAITRSTGYSSRGMAVPSSRTNAPGRIDGGLAAQLVLGEPQQSRRPCALLSRMVVSASCTTTPAPRFSTRLRWRSSLARSASSASFWAWTSVMVPAMRRACPDGVAGRHPAPAADPSPGAVGVPGAEHPVEVPLAARQDGLVDGAELAEVVGVHAARPVVGADQGVHGGPAGDLVHAGAVEHPPGDEVPLPVAVGAGVEDAIAAAPGCRAAARRATPAPAPPGTGGGGSRWSIARRRSRRRGWWRRTCCRGAGSPAVPGGSRKATIQVTLAPVTMAAARAWIGEPVREERPGRDDEQEVGHHRQEVGGGTRGLDRGGRDARPRPPRPAPTRRAPRGAGCAAPPRRGRR